MKIIALLLVGAGLILRPGIAAAQAEGGNADEQVVKAFVQALQAFPEPGESVSGSALNILTRMLEEGQLLVKSPDNTKTFRLNDSLAIIQKLVRFVKYPSRGVRINAVLILVNVVDNTTVCAVVDALGEDSLREKPDARFNLVQIVRVASENSTYAENKHWIEGTLERLKTRLKGETNVEKTLAEIAVIERNFKASSVAASAQRSLKKDFAQQRSDCAELPRIKALGFPADM